MKKALEIWDRGDALLQELREEGEKFHNAVLANQLEASRKSMRKIRRLNAELTDLEEEFAQVLGEGSRYLENLVLSLLTLAVIMVEAIGLSLAIALSRNLSRGLSELNVAAEKIGRGEFDIQLKPRSRDEIGTLTESVNRMGRLLKSSYSELEAKVAARTAELEKLAAENARLYEEAARALQRRDEFLSLASHELKTPLTSMLLQAQLLQRAKKPEEKWQQFTQLTIRQLQRMNGLVEEMLDTSRVDLSRLQLNFSPVDLSALVREVAERFSPEFAEAGSQLLLQIDDKILGVFDSDRIEQVVTNFLSNALKYAPGKPVEVRLFQEGNLATLKVSDQGVGVDPSDLERIFHRFERGKTTAHLSGLGVGLFISKAIVEGHGGRIGVESVLGRGSTFFMTLPLEGRTAVS